MCSIDEINTGESVVYFVSIALCQARETLSMTEKQTFKRKVCKSIIRTRRQ